MKSVLLRLEAPLQAWGTQGRFGIRDTDREPSKSGVVGLVGAALGMPRDDDATVATLAALRFAVRVDREGSLLRDYHTVGAGSFRGERYGIWTAGGSGPTALTERYYLADASFLAALGGDDRALVERIAAALRDPVWPLFLGRRSCPPGAPVFAGVTELAPDDAVKSAPYPVELAERAPDRLRLVLEADGAEGRPRQDVPESFAQYRRKHGLRHVRIEHIDRTSLPELS